MFHCYPISSIDKTNLMLLWLCIFLEENEILQFVFFFFITGITRSALRSCIFINHSLKHKVVIFAEFLKYICERVNFSKVRGLQLATLVPINTSTGIFQGFCLVWTNSYLTNTSQRLLLTKHKSKTAYKQ